MSIHDTALKAGQTFTTLPVSDSMVVLGQSLREGPKALHEFRLGQGKLQKRMAELSFPLISRDILGVVVEGQEFLAMTPIGSRDVKLLSVEAQRAQLACTTGADPWVLCHGESGRMWVWCNDNTARELYCETKTFTETGKTVKTTDFCHNMYYLPTPHRALVFCHNDWMEAICCERGQQLWKLDTVDGKEIAPKGTLLHPELQLLVAAEFLNDRILVLDPETGSLLQTLPSPRPSPQHLFWSQHQLLLLHHHDDRVFISHVQLVASDKQTEGE